MLLAASETRSESLLCLIGERVRVSLVYMARCIQMH